MIPLSTDAYRLLGNSNQPTELPPELAAAVSSAANHPSQSFAHWMQDAAQQPAAVDADAASAATGSSAQQTAAREQLANQHSQPKPGANEDPLREAFRDFVGQTLFGQMLSSMRSTVGKPAYFHGGRAEEVFSQQLDQVLVERITEASASTVADPMYDLFVSQRNR